MPTTLGQSFDKALFAKAGRNLAQDARLARTRAKSKATFGAVKPTAAIAESYRVKLSRLIEDMNRSYLYWLGAEFKKVAEQRELIAPINNPEMALDSAASLLQSAMNKLKNQWFKKFDKLASDLAKYFARSVSQRSDKDLQAILKKSGIAIEFQVTKGMKEALAAIVHENVALIKSIPQQYLQKVEGATMRSILAGRDLQQLKHDIKKIYNVTDKRAELIATDQNNKATGQLTAIRYRELGIKKAIWCHSHAGKCKRPSHVANDQKEYDIETGWFDPHEKMFITPGFLIRCFPGSTRLRWNRDIKPLKIWRSSFNGESVHLEVSSNLLKSTSNHPILTRIGWQRANAINEGDDVVCKVSQNGNIVADQENNSVTSFTDLFETCSLIFGNVRLCGSSFNFYGDVPQNKVDEISINSDLLRKLYIFFTEDSGEFNFAKAYAWIEKLIIFRGFSDISHSRCTRICNVLLSLFWSFGLSGNLIGLKARSNLNLPFSQDLIQDCSRYFESITNINRSSPLSIRSTDSHFYSERDILQESFRTGSHSLGSSSRDDKAFNAEAFADFISSKSNSFSGIMEFGSAFYEFRRVGKKSIRNLSSHVYTLQTTREYYIVGDSQLLAKNCKCFARPVLRKS
jgi:hypothetical protein